MAKQRRRLAPGDAVRVLQGLLREGKIAAHDIARHLEIAELEERLAILHGKDASSHGPTARSRRASEPAVSETASQARKRKRRVSSEGRASYRIQGQYIAYLRRFSKHVRAKYQQLAREHGREQAIAAMRKALAT
jgi:hypothetical protein